MDNISVYHEPFLKNGSTVIIVGVILQACIGVNGIVCYECVVIILYRWCCEIGVVPVQRAS